VECSVRHRRTRGQTSLIPDVKKGGGGGGGGPPTNAVEDGGDQTLTKQLGDRDSRQSFIGLDSETQDTEAAAGSTSSTCRTSGLLTINLDAGVAKTPLWDASKRARAHAARRLGARAMWFGLRRTNESSDMWRRRSPTRTIRTKRSRRFRYQVEAPSAIGRSRREGQVDLAERRQRCRAGVARLIQHSADCPLSAKSL